MIVWLNGPFGVGKTTVASALLAVRPDWSVFDPEEIGLELRRSDTGQLPSSDFQDLPLWRTRVIETLLARTSRGQSVVVVPQTVLNETYWDELVAGLNAHRVRISALTLHVEAEEHEHRIAADRVEMAAADWRRARRADYETALSWLRRQSTVIDTTALPIDSVADRILEQVG